METPINPLERSEKNISSEVPQQVPAEKNESISQIYEKPQKDVVEETKPTAEIAEEKPTTASPGVVVKKTGKKFEGRGVEKNATNLTKKADDLETEVLEEITEIHNLPNAKP